MMRWFAILVAAVLVVGLGAGSVKCRNELVALDVAAEAQWQQVESQLSRQHDLIPALVEITKGYASHERDTHTAIAAERAQGSPVPPAESPAEAATTLVRLLAVAEAYPDLKADRRFRDLQMEVSGTQNRVAVERHRYNELVAHYNARLRMLPWQLFAFELEEREFFEAEEADLEQPTVLF